jgi:signal transduction histidine kinase
MEALDFPVRFEDFPEGGMVLRTEHRVSRMLVLVRIATSFFAYIPLFVWGQLAHPWISLGAAAAASAEAAWFTIRVQKKRSLRDRLLVTVDVLFCLALMLVGTHAAAPDMRNTVATELIPTVLTGAAVVGFGFTFGAVQIAVVAGMMVGWVAAVAPNFTLKLPSDLLGFVLWYVISSLSMREFRDLAHRTDQAHQAAQDNEAATRRSAVEAEATRQRERVHLEVHDHLLPIVEHLVAGRSISDRLLSDAARAARRARRLIEDPRAVVATAGDGQTGDFAALLHDTIERGADRLQLESVLVITTQPAADLVEVLCIAVAEALRNTIRHAGESCQVNLYAESTQLTGQIIIRDRGPGFDPAAVSPGGGFSGTFAAVRQHGGDWTVDSAPGRGTTITLNWAPPPQRRRLPPAGRTTSDDR